MSKIGIAVYRMMEWIDGEKGIKIIPYSIAEKIKLLALKVIK